MNAEQQFPGAPEPVLTEPRWEMTREINAYRSILAAGNRALYMQLAHPQVAQAIEDSGYLDSDPLSRLRETARAGFDIIYGTPEEALRVARSIKLMHLHAHGVMKEDVGPHYHVGDLYDANDQDAQQWVASTIISSTVVGHEAFVGPLTTEQKDTYVNEVRELFATMGLEQDRLPDTYQGVEDYIQEMIDSQRVMVSATAKRLAPKTLLKGYAPGSEVLTSFQKLSTMVLLPDDLREQFGLQKPKYGQVPFFNVATKLIKQLPHFPAVIAMNDQARAAAKRNPEA